MEISQRNYRTKSVRNIPRVGFRGGFPFVSCPGILRIEIKKRVDHDNSKKINLLMHGLIFLLKSCFSSPHYKDPSRPLRRPDRILASQSHPFYVEVRCPQTQYRRRSPTPPREFPTKKLNKNKKIKKVRKKRKIR